MSLLGDRYSEPLRSDSGGGGGSNGSDRSGGGLLGGLVSGAEDIAEDSYDALAGTADHLAGSTDEAVGRAVEQAGERDYDAAGDEVAGQLDEMTSAVLGAIGDAGEEAGETLIGVTETSGAAAGGFFDELGTGNTLVLLGIAAAALYVYTETQT